MARQDDRLKGLKFWVCLIVAVVVAAYAIYFVLTICRCQPPPSPTTPTPVTPTPSPPAAVPSTPTRTPTGTPSATILRWIDPNGVVLDGAVLKPEKKVELEEVYIDDIGPNYFHVFEVYDTIFDSLTPRYDSGSPRAQFGAKKVQNGIAHSDRQWLLPAPSEFRGQSTFRFTDDRGNWSEWISSASFVPKFLRIAVTWGADLTELIPVEVKGEVEIEGEVIFAIDPEVSLVLMVPWGRGEANLKDHLFEYLEYLREVNPDIRPEDVDDFLRHFREYLPSERPEGWELTISPQTTAGGPFDRGWFTLKLTTPTSGKTFLAIKAIDCEDPSRFVVSEIIAIEGLPTNE